MELCGCGAPPGAPPHWWQVLSPGLGQEELEELERELLGLYGLDTEVGGDDPPCAPQVTPGPPPSPDPRPGPSRAPQYRHRPFRAPPD
ncbi:vasodilator-stimulated phosphoprotein-like [Pezoporus wallicus]|nr:vasodilator-stimulated phosphoprotein-like [Pezoporus wallicus]